jgi:CheY-like chemotaxis protein
MSMNLLERPQRLAERTDRRETILIIDDDEAMVDVLSRRLRQQGFATVTAETGAAGLAVARLKYPALILLGLRLPDIDGFRVCERLNDSPDTCDIPVIILSGMEGPDMVRRCRAAGAYFFVRKPYDPNALLVLIRQAIRERQAWAGSEG